MLLCEIIFQLIEDMIEVTIVRIVPNYAIVTIDDGKYMGSIHISQLSE